MPDDLEDEESEEEEEELRRCFMAASSGTAPAAKEGEEEMTVEREAQKGAARFVRPCLCFFGSETGDRPVGIEGGRSGTRVDRRWRC